MTLLLDKIRRGLRKPPRYIAERLVQEARGHAERHLAPLRIARATPAALARRAGHADCDAWWTAVASRSYLTASNVSMADLRRICPGDEVAILSAAERALAHEVDLLGSGPVQLGAEIDWHCDFKTGHRWPPAYCKSIEYNNLDRPSDVKVPWELSRMQWLIPAGQAYTLTGEDRYAEGVRDVIRHWIGANPYAGSVNWACTMDVALRLITWTWLFHVCKDSLAWSDRGFRAQLIQSLYLHGDFTARHLEKSDVNGNHYTADAAGLVFAGLFFGDRGEPGRWADLGWQILADELPRQVHPDGADFEASVPYHRLVQELFLLPALYRMKQGLDVPAAYRERLLAMARFTAAYSRSDGSVPLWGDADDARTLPFRQTPINDHRYLLALAGHGLGDTTLIDAFSGPRSEVLWIAGESAAACLPDRAAPLPKMQVSAGFANSGYYVLRNTRDHVFIDAGPVGFGNRGGHGHNDALSFEAVLDGAHLVSDCGAYLYTASWHERNNFRSTAYHNTPQIDGEEINRFTHPRELWTLKSDCRPEVEAISHGADRDTLVAAHAAYERLASPVRIRRTFTLHHARHRLDVYDEMIGAGAHTVEIPLHLAIGVDVTREADHLLLTACQRTFELSWSLAADWDVATEPARVSPSYGVVVPTTRVVWRRTGALKPLRIALRPLAETEKPRCAA